MSKILNDFNDINKSKKNDYRGIGCIFTRN